MTVRITQFQTLWSAVKKYDVHKVRNTEIKDFESGKGIDVTLGDIFHTTEKELFTILQDGSIRKSIIHIVDISSWKEEWGNPKFHIYHCEKIDEMQKNGKKYRYRASQGANGQFSLIKKDKKWNANLEICSYCLKMYNKKYNKNKTKNNFVISDYINQTIHHSNFQDIKWDICTIPNIYVKNWNIISQARKKMCKYRCENCSENLSSEYLKKFLHVHHVDADKQNNILGNLKTLCIECHSKEHNHGHIKRTPQYREYVEVINYLRKSG